VFMCIAFPVRPPMTNIFFHAKVQMFFFIISMHTDGAVFAFLVKANMGILASAEIMILRQNLLKLLD
jgi:hypothetical protein